MKTLNFLAKHQFGEFGFTTLTEEQQEYIINKYYKLKTLHEVLKTK